MIDIGQKLRQGYFELLNGAVTIEGSPVPFVDEKLDVSITDHDIYVLMSDQNERPIGNKTIYLTECDLSLVIVNRRKATATKEVVEDVSSQILNLVFPSKNVCSVVLGGGLRLSNAYLDNAEYSPLNETQDGFSITKTLIIKNTVRQ